MVFDFHKTYYNLHYYESKLTTYLNQSFQKLFVMAIHHQVSLIQPLTLAVEHHPEYHYNLLIQTHLKRFSFEVHLRSQKTTQTTRAFQNNSSIQFHHVYTD